MSADQLTVCAAARSNQNAQSLWELQGLYHAPQAFPSNVWGNMLLRIHIWVQYFNAVRAPVKHSEYLQGMSGDQLSVCRAARSNQNSQSLWGLQWVDHAPQVSPLKLAETFGTACTWMFDHECNISMQCTPQGLWNILNIYKEQLGTS